MLWWLFGIEPRADAARARLLRSGQALPDRRARWSPIRRSSRSSAGPTRRVCAATVDLNPGRFDWKLGVFRTDTFDDIIQLASVIQGRGFFQNVAATRRQGLEASVEYRAGPWTAYAGYSTHRCDLPVHRRPRLAQQSVGGRRRQHSRHARQAHPDGPAAPVQSRRRLRGDAEWKVGGDMVAVGSQYFVGDEANQNPKLPAYGVANLHTTYQVSKNVQVFGFINNLFNKKYGAVRHLLRAARRRQCRPADHPHRPAHRSPRPAVLDLRRRADEAIARQNPLCRSRRPAAGQDLAR